MINEYAITGNTFTNIFNGSGSDAFYIVFNSTDSTTAFSINLVTNIFVQ